MSNTAHIDEQAFILLSKTCALSKKIAARELREFGVTLAEYSLLRIVENSPRITSGEAKRRLYASAPSIAQLVKSLERKALISREHDLSDSRRQQILLTAKGRKRVTETRMTIERVFCASNISEGVMEALVDNLATLFSSLSPLSTPGT